MSYIIKVERKEQPHLHISLVTVESTFKENVSPSEYDGALPDEDLLHRQ